MKLTSRQKDNWKWLITEMGKETNIPYLHPKTETNYQSARISGTNLLGYVFLSGFYNDVKKVNVTPVLNPELHRTIMDDFGKECFETFFNKYSLFMVWLQNRIPSFDIDSVSLTPSIAKFLQEYMELYDDAVNGTEHTATIPVQERTITNNSIIEKVTIHWIDGSQDHFDNQDDLQKFFKNNPHRLTHYSKLTQVRVNTQTIVTAFDEEFKL